MTSNKDLKLLHWYFEEIKRTDKTPKYEYSKTDERDLDNNGDFPGRGKRWLMPRELADRGLELLDCLTVGNPNVWKCPCHGNVRRAGGCGCAMAKKVVKP